MGDAGTLTINVDVDVDGPYHLVRVSGEVDLASAPMLEDALQEFGPGGDVVVVDLSGVGFLDSSGLSVLVQNRQRLEGPTGVNGLRLVVTRPVIRRVFEVTGLAEVFTLASTLDEATQDL